VDLVMTEYGVPSMEYGEGTKLAGRLAG
jgi:hypothetical protein